MKFMYTVILVIYMLYFNTVTCLLPPKFQWKVIDFAWEASAREAALSTGAYVPENNLPSGIARWKDKLFITIPRWKTGVPASLNYIFVNGNQSQPLNPYPSWEDAFVSNKACCVSSNSTVVSAFRVHVDTCDRLWVVDNGVADMFSNVKQVTPPAIVIFDLNSNTLIHRYELPDDVIRDSSVLTGVVVETIGKGCADSYAYIPDMGSNSLIVYSLKHNDAWRVENHYFHFDPHSSVFRVGRVEFYWSDGVSSAVLAPGKKSSGHRDLYFHPTSSTKQFRMSTKLLRDRYVPKEILFNAAEILGERGPLSQATAADLDPHNNVMFYAQLNKNGVSCWNMERPLTVENVPLILSDCTVLEFPNDLKVDQESNLWVLSNRQSRFLYESIDSREVNFRILTAPTIKLIQGTPCEKMSTIDKALSLIRPKSKTK
ncbi:L-dopachrome tautomerase yellow-f-like [Zerene cesonia]|uniref:L-dopachrome tautomerase yellow-f-like n=1 Tax=Zerene cesonia TaxID=33412 RepID=UPI0018E57B0B|nr:L-dopachrome tautomerase yellow-f-like [Zerene cesonia]